MNFIYLFCINPPFSAATQLMAIRNAFRRLGRR